MRFADPLVPGRLLRRYKRFLSDVELDAGAQVTAHCANPGSMLGLTEPGSRVWLAPARGPKRKLAYSWELVEAEGALVGVNAGRPNAIVAGALAEDQIPELAGYTRHRREVRYGRRSRIDLLLEGGDRPPCYVEIKNVHLRRAAGLAEFPDSVTARGTRHLQELAEAAEAGARAVMVYLVQRGDCERFAVAADIDPAYARALDDALARGVEALCYACKVTPEAIELERRLPLDLRRGELSRATIPAERTTPT